MWIFFPCHFYGINCFLFGLTCWYYYLYSVGTTALHAYSVVVYHTSVVRGLSLLFLLWALRCALSDSLLTSSSSSPPLYSCQLGPPTHHRRTPRHLQACHTPSSSLCTLEWGAWNTHSTIGTRDREANREQKKVENQLMLVYTKINEWVMNKWKNRSSHMACITSC